MPYTPELTVAILAGGSSTRFGSEKALAKFRGRALVEHMVELGRRLSRNVEVVVSSEDQQVRMEEIVKPAMVVVDPEGSVTCPLTAAITAFEYAETPHTLLLPVDTPLASVPLLRMLVQLAPGHGAVVPSWPSGYIEPLHSVYLSEHAYAKGLEAMDGGGMRMQELLDSIHNVLYVSTEVLKAFDTELRTFFNVNTAKDLRALERFGRKR